MTSFWRKAVQYGLLAGVVTLLTCAIGMVEAFDERDLIVNILTLGQVLLFIPPLLAGYLTVADLQSDRPSGVVTVLGGLVAGVVTALPVVALIWLSTVWPTIRDFFVNVSPSLMEILTFGLEPIAGSLVLMGVMGALGAVGAALHLIPIRIRRPLTLATGITLAIALFSDVPLNIANELLPRSIVRQLLGTKGIMPVTAIVIFVLSLAIAFWWELDGRDRSARNRATRTPETRTRNQRIGRIAFFVILLILPWVLGVFLTNVVDQVGTFILMALGLNIVVGFAGLLDLGYVAFFAIGAYVTGVLTSTGDLGFGWDFWLAVPVAVLSATFAGILLGIPVLRMRGDYLAIVTLGFGEIIRVLVRSDLLKGAIGGAQGIINIPRPTIAGFEFVTPQHYYYLILAGCLVAWYVASRLRDGRLGRQWMAMREDEDVAEAMGINLTLTKLSAFAIGATLAGLAGAIFASRLGSVFPNSFELLISINVLAIVIVGGIGSLPGVVLGAFVLVGLPELLREFEEYRLLMYGILLVTMMLVRPEGLWPSAITKRELHADAEAASHEYDTAEEVNPLT